MNTIWKYELEITDGQTISGPELGMPLSVGVQNGKLMLWALVNTNDGSKTINRTIVIYGTGNPVHKEAKDFDFIGTVIMPPFVWHVFHKPEWIT